MQKIQFITDFSPKKSKLEKFKNSKTFNHQFGFEIEMPNYFTTETINYFGIQYCTIIAIILPLILKSKKSIIQYLNLQKNEKTYYYSNIMLNK